MRSLYLLIDGLVILVPFCASFSRRIRFYREFRAFFLANLVVGIFFVTWDACFRHLGVWDFNPLYVEGVSFLQLPLEEILFFVCIPFSCLFTYYCLDLFHKLDHIPAVGDLTAVIIIITFVSLSVAFHERLYTSSVLGSTALSCLIAQWFGKGRLLGKCAACYAILLFPFFLVNGILTGTGLPEAIVRYNNSENLGVRVLTIPVEDIFYGFSLITLTIAFFEVFRRRDVRGIMIS